MPTLHLMVGLPGSGKTTEAKRLAIQYHAVRLTPDEWQLRLYGSDFVPGADNSEHDRRHTMIEEIMRELACELLNCGADVILDFGLWAKVERDELRDLAQSLGADFRIHYMACELDELWHRIEIRNRMADELSVFRIGRADLDEWYKLFEPPSDEELTN